MFADSYGLLQDRVNAVVGDTEKATLVFNKLANISAKTGASLNLTASGFQKLSFAKDTLQATDAEMIKLTKSFAELGLISGSSVQQLEAGMLQFSQGLISGTFQAQEFQSVLENVPAITQHIATGMGITVEELIKMKKEGKLVSKDVFDAIINQSEEISEIAAGMPVRLSRGFSRFMLSIQAALGEIDKTNSITLKLGQTLFDAGDKAKNIPIYLQATIDTIKKFSKENEKITQLLVTFATLQTAVIAANVALAITRGLLMAISSANPFILLATSVIVFRDEVMAASTASQKLITAFAHLLNLDFKSAKNEILGIKDAYEEALKGTTVSTDAEQSVIDQAKNMADGFLSSFDISKTSVVQDFYANVEQITKDHNDKMNALMEKNNIDSEEKEKQKAFLAVQWEQWKNNTIRAFNTQATAEQVSAAGENFATQISQASQYSKQFFEINKAMSMANLAVKTPEAIGNAYTFGSAIGGPVLGGIFGATAGAAMGAQIAAISQAKYTPRAIGGDVFPGSYLVGENGPEILTMGSSGHITPNHALGKASNVLPKITVNVHNAQNQTAQVTTTQNEDNIDIDIILQTVENNLVNGINTGESSLSKSLQNNFALNRVGSF
jgi:tape measure domain-containing protein